MRIALYTLTWDRLELTRHCFETLWSKAGHEAEVPHYVLDQGSMDGTPAWLNEHRHKFAKLLFLPENVGIPRGANILLNAIASSEGCDMAAKFDNDCEIVTPDLFDHVARLHELDPKLAISPEISGSIEGTYWHHSQRTLGPYRVASTDLLAGLCMAVPWSVFGKGFRFCEERPIYGGEDSELTRHLLASGHHPAYAMDLEVRHWPSTKEQDKRYPEYNARKQKAVDQWVREKLIKKGEGGDR